MPILIKMRYWIGAIALLLFACIILAALLRPSAKDFFYGSRKVVLTRIKFDGQAARATLEDKTALEYLASRPKLKTLSSSEGGDQILTFSAECFDKWGPIGRLDIGISTDKKVWSLTVVDSWFGPESRRYLVIDSNRPAEVDKLMTFLLDEKSHGVSWQDEK